MGRYSTPVVTDRTPIVFLVGGRQGVEGERVPYELFNVEKLIDSVMTMAKGYGEKVYVMVCWVYT
jgi:hypothetical protein